MRVIDLLEFLKDIQKNEMIFANFEKEDYSIDLVEKRDEKIFCKLSKNKKSLKNWELLLLLNKKDQLDLPVFVEKDKKNHQIFGMRLGEKKIVLY